MNKIQFRITCDSNSETRVGIVVDKISGPIRKFFEQIDFGDSINKICMVLMCRDPKINFKQRTSFSEKDKILYSDLMLDYQMMITASNDQKRLKIISEKILSEFPSIIKKYKFKNFNDTNFTEQLSKFLNNYNFLL